MFKSIIYFLFILSIGNFLFPVQSNAQSLSTKGLPFITNYRYQDYNADGVNWWVEEDNQGVLYFANTRGILVFDGQHWEVVKPPSVNETRSLAKGKDGKIYVGTNGDIGYLASGKKGKLEFVSLKEKLPPQHRQFGEVWETHEFDGKIFFRSNNKIFIWDTSSFKVLESKEAFHVGDVVNGQYYCRIWTRGLTILKNDSFYVVPNGEKFANERIYAMLPYDDTRMLIGTRTQGLFIYDGKDFTPFKTEADPYIYNTSLYGGLVLSNGLFAINTFNDGMVIIDKNGKLIQRIDKTVGLQDNSVDQVFEDSRGIIWLPLFNGIAKLDLRSSLTYYNESLGLPAKTVFAVGSNNGVVYASTNNGIYMLNKSNNRFEKLPGTSGQSGNFIKNGNDYLVAGAEQGLLKLTGGKVIPVIPGVNYDFHVRQFLRSKIDTTVFYVDLRSGLAIVRYSPSSQTYSVEAFNENFSSNNGFFNETKDGSLFIIGDNIGELKLVKPDRSGGKWKIADQSVEIFNASHGLPKKVGGLSEYEGILYFISEKDSIFAYDEKQKRFKQDTSSFLKHYVVNDADATAESPIDASGKIWANYGKGVFVKLPTKDGSVKIIDAPFRELGKNYPVWFILPTTDNNGKELVWLSGREGIIRYDGSLDETSSGSFNTIIREISLNQDSVYYSGFSLPSSSAEFTNKWNSVRFQFSAPFFKHENETVFSSYLEGRDKSWTEWTTQTFREFGNLPAGKYTFHVKAKNIYDVESTEAAYTFNVLPPWYATWWAYLLYALIAGSVIYLLVRWRTRQLHEKHRELEKIVEDRTHELKQRAEELGVINSVQEGLAKELDIAGIYNLVGDRLCDLFPDTQTLVIRTFDHETGLEYWHYSKEKGQRQYVDPRPFNWNSKLLIQTKKPLDIKKDYVEISKKTWWYRSYCRTTP